MTKTLTQLLASIKDGVITFVTNKLKIGSATLESPSGSGLTIDTGAAANLIVKRNNSTRFAFGNSNLTFYKSLKPTPDGGLDIGSATERVGQIFIGDGGLLIYDEASGKVATIKHDGSQAIIDSGTGDIYIRRAGSNMIITTGSQLRLGSSTKAPTLLGITTTQRDALTVTDGMIIYNTTLGKFQGREAGAWANLI